MEGTKRVIALKQAAVIGLKKAASVVDKAALIRKKLIVIVLE